MQTALRGTIKRTINEKLVVCSKKHANPQELEVAIQFLSKMISGKSVERYSPFLCLQRTYLAITDNGFKLPKMKLSHIFETS